jgi:hypothetical protein
MNKKKRNYGDRINIFVVFLPERKKEKDCIKSFRWREEYKRD